MTIRVAIEEERGDGVCPERQLAVSVLFQALVDATGGIKSSCPPRDYHEAVTFLTSDETRWKGARHAWCDQAGIDPDAFEERVARTLDQVARQGLKMIVCSDGIERITSSRSRFG